MPPSFFCTLWHGIIRRMIREIEKATETYDADVDRLQIARYYLESELPNILHDEGVEAHTLINNSVQRLSDKQTWRLLEALSYTYRINNVFALVSNAGYDWQEVELPLDAITLTGTRPHIDKIVYSEEIQQNPEKFARYLQAYFSEHVQKDDDPLDLNEFRPRDEPIVHDTLIVRQTEDGLIKMVDGTHRLIARGMAGEGSFRCYCAVPNDEPALHHRGDSLFVTLRRAYLAMPEHQDAILEVTKALAKDSLDGIDAVKDYWVTHARTDDARQIGQALLAEITSASEPAQKRPVSE